MKNVTIYTDGSCLGNPGPGGWCAILLFGDKKKILSGGVRNTTNNAMELMGAIKGLSVLKFPCNVRLYTDSMYVKNGMTSWILKWKSMGWKKGKSQEIKNLELWKELDKLCSIHNVDFKWVKAHAGHAINDEVDKIARSEATKISINSP